VRDGRKQAIGWLAAACVFVGLGAAKATAQSARTRQDARSVSVAELRIVAAKVQLLLIAPNGKKTGYDPTTKRKLRAIAHSGYYEDALLEYDSGRVDPNTTQTIDVRRPAAGTYRLIVSPGTAADGEEYEVRIHLYSQDGSGAKDARIAGTARQGSSEEFEFRIGAASSGVEVVEPPSRRAGHR